MKVMRCFPLDREAAFFIIVEYSRLFAIDVSV